MMNTIFGRDIESSASKSVSDGHAKPPTSKPNVNQNPTRENGLGVAPVFCERFEMVKGFMVLRFPFNGNTAVDAADLGLICFTRTRQSDRTSCQDRVDHMSVNVGQATLDSVVVVSQAFVIDA